MPVSAGLPPPPQSLQPNQTASLPVLNRRPTAAYFSILTKLYVTCVSTRLQAARCRGVYYGRPRTPGHGTVVHFVNASSPAWRVWPHRGIRGPARHGSVCIGQTSILPLFLRRGIWLNRAGFLSGPFLEIDMLRPCRRNVDTIIHVGLGLMVVSSCVAARLIELSKLLSKLMI